MRRTPGCVHGQNASDSHLRLIKNSPKAGVTPPRQVGGLSESLAPKEPNFQISSKARAPSALGSRVPANNFVLALSSQEGQRREGTRALFIGAHV